ncbi:MAG TPA: chemotaxis protein CheW [Terriglobales bacterium]|nr:chemotaxis protein CheW [Terriglobales bacterium]
MQEEWKSGRQTVSASDAAGDLLESDALIADTNELTQPEQLEPERQYCIFRAGRERFCLAVLDVEEVVDWPAMTRLPLGPPFLMGVFNLRGSIVPVIDIAVSEGRRPDLPPKRVVVAKIPAQGERGDLRVGIAADDVIGTYTTREPLLVHEAPKDVPHCCGMLRQDDRLALAIDLKKLVEAFRVPVI